MNKAYELLESFLSYLSGCFADAISYRRFRRLYELQAKALRDERDKNYDGASELFGAKRELERLLKDNSSLREINDELAEENISLRLMLSRYKRQDRAKNQNVIS